MRVLLFAGRCVPPELLQAMKEAIANYRRVQAEIAAREQKEQELEALAQLGGS